MAKGDPAKPRSVPNKHLHSRISYLYQAATYLAVQSGQQSSSQQSSGQQSSDTQSHGKEDAMEVDAKAGPDVAMRPGEAGQTAFSPGLPFYYVSHLQSVSMKSQIRLSQNVKHSICKRCSAILVPGSSSSRIENLSRGGKKPWADVLVVECNVCKAQKRFPVGAKRQPRKSERAKVEKARPAATRAAETLGMEDRTSITPLVEEIGLHTPK